MFRAHVSNEKIAEELLAETKSPRDAYKFAIRREKGVEDSQLMNPVGITKTQTHQQNRNP